MCFYSASSPGPAAYSVAEAAAAVAGSAPAWTMGTKLHDEASSKLDGHSGSILVPGKMRAAVPSFLQLIVMYTLSDLCMAGMSNASRLSYTICTGILHHYVGVL